MSLFLILQVLWEEPQQSLLLKFYPFVEKFGEYNEK